MPEVLSSVSNPLVFRESRFPIDDASPFQRAHKRRSSFVELVPTDGVLVKKKLKRKPENALWEVICLMIWEQHLSINQCVEVPIASPAVYEFDGRDIRMHFQPGVPGRSALSGDFPNDLKLTKQEKRLARARFVVGVGRFIGMLERDSVLHGDLDLRHLLFDPRSHLLSAIDVEGSRMGSEDEVRAEIAALLKQITKRLPTREVWRDKCLELLQVTRQAAKDAPAHTPMIQSIRSVRESLRRQFGIELDKVFQASFDVR